MSETDHALRVADALEGELERALWKAFRAAQDEANVAGFACALARGELNRAVESLKLSKLSEKLYNG